MGVGVFGICLEYSSRYGLRFVVSVSELTFLEEGWDRGSGRRSGLSMMYMKDTLV